MESCANVDLLPLFSVGLVGRRSRVALGANKSCFHPTASHAGCIYRARLLRGTVSRDICIDCRHKSCVSPRFTPPPSRQADGL